MHSCEGGEGSTPERTLSGSDHCQWASSGSLPRLRLFEVYPDIGGGDSTAGMRGKEGERRSKGGGGGGNHLGERESQTASIRTIRTRGKRTPRKIHRKGGRALPRGTAGGRSQSSRRQQTGSKSGQTRSVQDTTGSRWEKKNTKDGTLRDTACPPSLAPRLSQVTTRAFAMEVIKPNKKLHQLILLFLRRFRVPRQARPASDEALQRSEQQLRDAARPALLKVLEDQNSEVGEGDLRASSLFREGKYQSVKGKEGDRGGRRTDSGEIFEARGGDGAGTERGDGRSGVHFQLLSGRESLVGPSGEF